MTKEEIKIAAEEYCANRDEASVSFNTMCINDLIKFATSCIDRHERDMRKANGGYNSITAALYEKQYQDAENARKRLLEENDKLRCENRASKESTLSSDRGRS